MGTTLGQPAVNQREIFIFPVSRRTHKLFGPVNPGTTSRVSQGHLDVNQSKKFMFMCMSSPGSKDVPRWAQRGQQVGFDPFSPTFGPYPQYG